MDSDERDGRSVVGSLPIETVLLDLDGTLISSDMLWETLWLLLCREPLRVFSLPGWLAKGKAGFKHEIASRVEFDASLLPYRDGVLDYLENQRARGCRPSRKDRPRLVSVRTAKRRWPQR